MNLYALEFELEEFGQNVSHIVRKTYYTYDFFTDRQVYAAITRNFEFIGRDNYDFKIVPCSLAIPLVVEKQRIWFSDVNADFQKEQNTGALTFITEGYQEYLVPGSKFLTFSWIKPEQNTLFIGKKSAIAYVTELEKTKYNIINDAWTTQDLIYFNNYENQIGKGIFEIRLKEASQRFLVGEFKCSKVLETEYNNQKYRFYNLANFINS